MIVAAWGFAVGIGCIRNRQGVRRRVFALKGAQVVTVRRREWGGWFPQNRGSRTAMGRCRRRLLSQHNAAQAEYDRSAALVSRRRQAEATQDDIPAARP